MLTGVILAGGENRRMKGKMKSFLSFGDETIFERQVERMKTLCRELVIVTHQPSLFSDLTADDDTIRIITDDMPRKGPLAGIYSAICCSKEDNLWVVACDMPHISPEAAKVLLAKQNQSYYDAAIPIIDGTFHPLHGVYNKRIESRLKCVLQNEQYKVKSFLDHIKWIPVQQDLFSSENIDLRFTMNLNTPQEYEQALKTEEPSSKDGE